MNIIITDEARDYLKTHKKTSIMVYKRESITVLPEIGRVSIPEVHQEKPDESHIDEFDLFHVNGIDIYFQKVFEAEQEEIVFKVEHALFLKWLTVHGLRYD